MAGSKRKIWIGVALVVLVVIFIVASVAKSRRGKSVDVRTETVATERIESWVRAPGQIRPERLIQISSNVQGRVEKLLVAEGDVVERGDLLLVLDDQRYRSALAGIQAQVDAGAADLDLAQAQREKSRLDLERTERLHGESLVSDEALLAARTQATVDEARLVAARQELRRRRAALEEARNNLEETVFRAAMTGVITSLNVEEGENVITGTMNNPGTVILTLADLDTMEVAADVDETDVVRVQGGQQAKVKVDAWEDSVLAGEVTSVGMSGRRASQSGQQQGTNFEVLVRIFDPPDHLRPGMSADVEILTGARDSALVIPIQALVAHPETVVREWMEERTGDGDRDRPEGETSAGDRPRRRADGDDEDGGRADREVRKPEEKLVEGVFLDRDGIARFVPVVLGLRGDTKVEIGGEIVAGDRVVTGPYRALRKLKDGEAIKAKEAVDEEEAAS